MDIPAIKHYCDAVYEPIQKHWKPIAAVAVAVVVDQVFGRIAFAIYCGVGIVICTNHHFHVQGVALALCVGAVPFLGYIPGVVAAGIACSALLVQEWRLYALRSNFESELTKLGDVEKKLTEHRLERERLSKENHQKIQAAADYWTQNQTDETLSLEQQEARFTKNCTELNKTVELFTEFLKRVQSSEWEEAQHSTLDELQQRITKFTQTVEGIKSTFDNKTAMMNDSLQKIERATSQINTLSRGKKQ